MKRFITFFLLVLAISEAWSCTAVIASGKVTADGRPFIFKNRDASDGTNNSLLTLQGTKYQYVGVVNYSTSSSPTSIWYGHNEAGFAILNTLSYYFNSPTSKANTSAGALMKKALGQCATVDEFEALLQQTQAQTTPVTLSTNFAVMDSLGNVAFFETCNTSYTKFDANDETVAPNGYLVRTNYSFTSPYYYTTNHVGEQRYKAACKYIEDTFGDGKIDAMQVVHDNWVDDYWREFYEQATSSITTIATDKNYDDAYYSIGGIRYPKIPTSPGIYINNHRKVLIK